MKKNKIVIVIPAKNEEKTISKTLYSYTEYFESLEKKGILSYKILVVVNGSTDNTQKIVESYKNRNVISLNLKKSGKGNALIEGFNYAIRTGSDLYGFVDGDLSTRPEEFYKLINELDEYDVAIGSRYLKNSKVIPRINLTRFLPSRLFNLVIRMVFSLNLKDTQCGAKIFKKEVIEKINSKLTSKNWLIDIDLIYNSKKYDFLIKEVPINWYQKKDPNLKILKDTFQVISDIFKLRFHYFLS